MDGAPALCPASADFAAAVELGLGWAMLPMLQAEAALAAGRLVRLDAAETTVPLFWQQWNLRSALLDAIAAEVRAEADAYCAEAGPGTRGSRLCTGSHRLGAAAMRETTICVRHQPVPGVYADGGSRRGAAGGRGGRGSGAPLARTVAGGASPAGPRVEAWHRNASR